MTIYSELSHEICWFSIVMLVYQRVNGIWPIYRWFTYWRRMKKTILRFSIAMLNYQRDPEGRWFSFWKECGFLGHKVSTNFQREAAEKSHTANSGRLSMKEQVIGKHDSTPWETRFWGIRLFGKATWLYVLLDKTISDTKLVALVSNMVSKLGSLNTQFLVTPSKWRCSELDAHRTLW